MNRVKKMIDKYFYLLKNFKFVISFIKTNYLMILFCKGTSNIYKLSDTPEKL